MIEIGAEAFRGANIKSIDLPDSLKKIEQIAFLDTKVTEWFLPEGLTYIERGALGSESSDTVTIHVPCNKLYVEAYGLETKGKFTKVYFEGNTPPEFEAWAFGSQERGDYITWYYPDTWPSDTFEIKDPSFDGWLEYFEQKVWSPVVYPVLRVNNSITNLISTNDLEETSRFLDGWSYKDYSKTKGQFEGLVPGEDYIIATFDFDNPSELSNITYLEQQKADQNGIIKIENTANADIYAFGISYVKAINLDKTETELEVKETEQLIAQVLPNNVVDYKLEWCSNNQQVAKVNENGLVTAVGAGIAKITAKIGNIEASCNVTVTGKQQLKGDVNDDGRVTLYDALQILKQAILKGSLTGDKLYIMDYNDDGKVTLFDALKFLQKAILG